MQLKKDISSKKESNKKKRKEKEFEVEKILDERTIPIKDEETGDKIYQKEYLVKWVGYKKPTWEPEENLEHSQDLLKDFFMHKIIEISKEKKSIKNNGKQIVNITGTTVYIDKKRKRSADIIEEIKEDIDQEPSAISSSEKNKNKKKKNQNKIKKKANNKKQKQNINDVNVYEIEISDNDETEEEKEAEKVEEKKEIPIINENITLIHEENKENKSNVSQIVYIDKSTEANSVNDLGFKIVKIMGMKVPEKNSEGINLNIIIEKNNQIYLEKFNTKTEEIPNDYLVKFYERFICEKSPGIVYDNEMTFEPLNN